MEINEVLADVKQEGSDPFASLEKVTPTVAPAETEPKDEEKKEKPEEGDNTPEKELPFHKHPRWIEREEELKVLREFKESATTKLSKIDEIESRLPGEKTEVPDWFKELYGDNEVAYQKYNEHHQKEVEEIEQSLIERQEKQRLQAQNETTKWNEWVDGEIGKLSTSTGLDFSSKKDEEGKESNPLRNKLIKTMLDYSPTDSNNNLDFQKGYKIYQVLETKVDNTEKSQARKILADTTLHTSKGEKEKKDYMTPADLRNKSWANIV